jgi:ribulose-phosphate 3-epimerase
MVNIIPAILRPDLKSFEDDLIKVWQYVTRVQVDVVDGVFSSTTTMGPEMLNQIDTIVNFDVHLMVDRPEDWVGRCVMGGVDRVIGQVERMVDPADFIAKSQEEGLRVGLGFNLETPLTLLSEFINDIDCILLMSVQPGEQGRKFDESVLNKIQEVRRISKSITIIIDGGLDEKDIKRCLAAEWAEEIAEDELDREVFSMEFVIGSHLLNSSNIENGIDKFAKLTNP